VAPAVAEAIWGELDGERPSVEARAVGLQRETAPFSGATRLSRAVRVVLYAGALLVIGSFGWWSSDLDWSAGPLLALSVLYATGFLAVAFYARARRFDELAAAAAMVVAFYAPVCAYAALAVAGVDFRFEEDGVAAFYLWVDGGWIWLELAAIAAAATLYGLFRAPLLMLPLCLFVLFLAMDGTARAFGIVNDDTDTQAIGAFVLAFGVLAAATGVLLDYGGFRRHALWPHVFAAVGVVSGLEVLLGEHAYELALVLAGAVFLAAGVWLGRVGYLIAGGLALWVGITALAPSPIVLTVSGLGLVASAVWLSLGQSPLRRWLQARTLPAPQVD
jgi:hypothetical protein